MLRNAYRSGLWGMCCALVVLWFSASVAYAEEVADHDQITLYRAVSYYSDEASFDSVELKNSPSEQIFAKLMQDAGRSVKIRYLPLKRAISLYQADPVGCVIAPLPVNTEVQQSSDIYYMNPFWIYVMKDRDFKSIDDLRSFGNIDGADDFIGRTILGGLERINAPSFQVLMAMLRSRRVDAIPLGELAQLNEPEVGKTIVPLSEEPFLKIPHRLRCKRTPKTMLMLEAFNRAIAENPPAP